MTIALQDNKVTTIVEKRPQFEGSNICSWIGFKHVMYLAEEAVLEHLRNLGFPPRKLFEEFGLCLEIVDSSARILHALHMDDSIRIEVQQQTQPSERMMTFSVLMFVQRENKELKAYTGRIKLLFRQDRGGGEFLDTEKLPTQLLPYVVAEIKDAESPKRATSNIEYGRGTDADNVSDDLIQKVVPEGDNAFVWKWHIPYFYCHFTERIQHSGYLRLMEEVVDLFLANRGISIRTMLDTRWWIPVVPSADVKILQEALMEETIYIVYTVENLFKNTTYTSRMDCYVKRDGTLIHTATGNITHGYAKIQNRRDWTLVEFDAETLNALTNRGTT